VKSGITYTFSDVLASTKKCTAGFYCDAKFLPTPCGKGQYCPSGSSSPTRCPQGFYCSSPSEKRACTVEEFCPMGSTAPQPVMEAPQKPFAGSSPMDPKVTLCFSHNFTDGAVPMIFFFSKKSVLADPPIFERFYAPTWSSNEETLLNELGLKFLRRKEPITSVNPGTLLMTIKDPLVRCYKGFPKIKKDTSYFFVIRSFSASRGISKLSEVSEEIKCGQTPSVPDKIHRIISRKDECEVEFLYPDKFIHQLT
jgi:hypothetical protein